MSDKKIKIEPAKGRPMLNWVGKKPLDYIKSFPAQLVEVFDPSGKSERIENPTFAKLDNNWQNMLFHGDNKEVLSYLIANGFRGKVNLIYIDPPFDSGANYIRQPQIRGIKENTPIDGEDYTLNEQLQYHDIWSNDTYLQYMYERLILLKELLKENGSIYVHLDYRRVHQIRIIMDEIFGSNSFENEIIWKRTTSRGGSKYYNHIHDAILFYAKGESPIWNQLYTEYSKSYIETMFKNADEDGRKWRESPLTAPGISKGLSGSSWKGVNPSKIGKGRHWAIPGFIRDILTEKAQDNTIKALDELEVIGRIIWSKNGEGIPNFKQYEDDLRGVELQSIWSDVNGSEQSDYPTEKPESLLNRIVQASSRPDDIVLDCFMGSGTTLAVTQRLGRKFIGVDLNKGAVQTTSKRLQNIIKGQINGAKINRQGKILEEESHKLYAFTVYKVNDYDLQVLRTEAIELAVEHIGIQRMKTDSYFEGMLGKNLVKIIDFNHPLTMLDLQLLQDELKKRPDENRNVTIVCLGKELAVDPWIEDYNKKHPVNKLEIIELRTDTKYGKFLIHKPIDAKIDIKRKSNKALIEIKDFISPSIIERLNTNETMFKVKITDFRSMIDVVLIDTNYDGKVFNIVNSDVPEKKNDFVAGQYELDIPKDKVKVAVKIIDMLGEEMVEVKEI